MTSRRVRPIQELLRALTNLGLVGVVQRWRRLSPLPWLFHLLQLPQDLLLLGGDPLLHRVVHLERVLQAEQVILPPVSGQLLCDLLLGFVAASVAQLRQLLGIAFAGHSRHPIDVGKPHDARARSSGPGSSASCAANPHSLPPGWPYPVPEFAACIPLPPAGTNPAAVRNCAAAESTRNRWDRFSCPAPVPAPVVAYPPARLANLALLTPRGEQSNKPPYFPWPPTLPDVPLATPPGAAIPASSLRSWRFLDRSHPASERTPSAAHCPDQLPPRCDE